MKILTGNDLKSGAVVWWDGSGWSTDVASAVDAGTDADTILAREQADRRVNAAYAVAASETPQGARPAHIKDRIRALGGPTMLPGLTLHPDAVNQVT